MVNCSDLENQHEIVTKTSKSHSEIFYREHSYQAQKITFSLNSDKTLPRIISSLDPWFWGSLEK